MIRYVRKAEDIEKAAQQFYWDRSGVRLCAKDFTGYVRSIAFDGEVLSLMPWRNCARFVQRRQKHAHRRIARKWQTPAALGTGARCRLVDFGGKGGEVDLLQHDAQGIAELV
ncbi:MAG: hypothetical protein ABIT83_00655 [Massilia sp.]